MTVQVMVSEWSRRQAHALDFARETWLNRRSESSYDKWLDSKLQETLLPEDIDHGRLMSDMDYVDYLEPMIKFDSHLLIGILQQLNVKAKGTRGQCRKIWNQSRILLLEQRTYVEALRAMVKSIVQVKNRVSSDMFSFGEKDEWVEYFPVDLVLAVKMYVVHSRIGAMLSEKFGREFVVNLPEEFFKEADEIRECIKCRIHEEIAGRPEMLEKLIAEDIGDLLSGDMDSQPCFGLEES
jgi:hypothetical protein